MTTEAAFSQRPTPGQPRPYHFPPFERTRLTNGLNVLVVDLPGRPLLSASLVVPNGASNEPAPAAGSTVLAARALTEGTARYDAIALTEAAERLGASLHAEAGWDAFSVGVDVTASRLRPALELLAEVMANPVFPASEVERIRDERLNDILQARADPRRRADEAFAETIYVPQSPYHRPVAGTTSTVREIDRSALESAWRRGFDPAAMSLIVAGDLTGLDVPRLADELMGSWARSAGQPLTRSVVDDRSAVETRHLRLVHRPGAVQTEIRIGHPGLPRRTPDFHAVSVMSAILGGLFNSRLNMKLREEKGYTYGAGAGFDMRRGAGPFAARAAVNTEVTAPAIADFLAELNRMRDEPVADRELAAARDFLVGVFPLRFETPGPIVGALAGIVVHDLPDDELARYRAEVETVTVDDVLAAARSHIDLEHAAIVLVGDADRILPDLEAAGFTGIDVVRDEGPVAKGSADGVEDELGPVDSGDDGGPVEEPDVEAAAPEGDGSQARPK